MQSVAVCACLTVACVLSGCGSGDDDKCEFKRNITIPHLNKTGEAEVFVEGLNNSSDCCPFFKNMGEFIVPSDCEWILSSGIDNSVNGGDCSGSDACHVQSTAHLRLGSPIIPEFLLGRNFTVYGFPSECCAAMQNESMTVPSSCEKVDKWCMNVPSNWNLTKEQEKAEEVSESLVGDDKCEIKKNITMPFSNKNGEAEAFVESLNKTSDCCAFFQNLMDGHVTPTEPPSDCDFKQILSSGIDFAMSGGDCSGNACHISGDITVYGFPSECCAPMQNESMTVPASCEKVDKWCMNVPSPLNLPKEQEKVEEVSESLVI